MRIDAHAHIYHGDEERYVMKEEPFRPALAMGTIQHLRREMAANAVDKVVLVQTGSAYRWDNALLADTARGNADWAVGVCTLDPEGEDSVAELQRLVADSNVKGLRMEVSPAGFRHSAAERLWDKARELSVVVCAHLHKEHLGGLGELLSLFPTVRVVLDHCAYPRVEEGVEDKTLRAVVDLARFTNLHAKLSFGVTASQGVYPFADTHAQLRCIVDAYGAERCMWGSGFPCEHWLKKASYGEHLAIFERELGLSAGEKEWVLGGTAARVWFGE
ncbi:MAG: L-fuconolactonase [Candidatus Latescibacterota bacterium]|jgi:L-fuconolactonase